MRINDLVMASSENFKVEVFRSVETFYSGGILDIDGDLLTSRVYTINVGESSGILYIEV